MENTIEKKNSCPMEKNVARLEKMRANLAKLEEKAETILCKETLSHEDKMQLLELINCNVHGKGSKIETIASIDSTACCEFCEKMRNNKDNPLVICNYCYAFAESWKEAQARRHKLNAKILSSVLFTKEELQTLYIPAKLCRINEDGDIVNAIHAQNILRIQLTHENNNFGFWFKNALAVEKGLANEGITNREQLPKNVVFVQSSILIGFPASPCWFTDCVFTVFPNEETTLQAIANGAFECNGRKCKDCGYNCYLHERSEKVQYIAELLRCNKEKRKTIEQAYFARIAEKGQA